MFLGEKPSFLRETPRFQFFLQFIQEEPSEMCVVLVCS